MANKRLAIALRALRKQNSNAAIPTSALDRQDRELLMHAGFIKPVIDGWYIKSNPYELDGAPTYWYASMHSFVNSYCHSRFSKKWYLSPESSLSIHTGDTVIPQHIQIHTKNPSNYTQKLIHDSSLMFYTPSEFLSSDMVEEKFGLRVMKLAPALISVSANYFKKKPHEAMVALSQLKDIGELIRILIAKSKPVVAGRLVGGFAALGRDDVATQIKTTLQAVGLKVQVSNPFENESVLLKLPVRPLSPYSERLVLMWESMRSNIIDIFGDAPNTIKDSSRIMKEIEDRYKADAYNSLSIEGYKITEQLIDKVSHPSWMAEINKEDLGIRNTLAARGYYESHLRVTDSIRRILEEGHPGAIAQKDHTAWFMALFQPMVLAQLIEAQKLAGYRRKPIYIQSATHTPPPYQYLDDIIPTLFELLQREDHPAMRAVMGHFAFVFIHPFFDGNGRIARFLMNAMLVSGGYPWTTIRFERRNEYFAALNEASSMKNIIPFAQFIKSEMH
jgi:hypothetical protein